MQGSQLGKYSIKEELGSGAFATVYLAEDTLLKRKAAIKILKPLLASDEETRQRFLQEAQVLANLQHNRLAGVWDIGEDHGQFIDDGTEAAEIGCTVAQLC